MATPDTRTLISQLEYNDIGQVLDKNMQSADSVHFLQTEAYTYNERGWLLTSSAPLFQMQLQYNSVNNVGSIAPTAQYNGNIASQSYGTQAAPNDTSFTYSYDKLNRLLSGTNTAGYTESGINYDVEGNITSLNRFTTGSAQIDQLAYTYNTGTNQLLTVVDGNSSNAGMQSGTTSYQWDGNGNMMSATNPANTHGNKNFTYNLLNLPLVVTNPYGTITYTYDAAGDKLRKVSVQNGITKTTDYISGIEYDNSTTAISFIQTEEGKATPNGTTAYDYNYYLGDNLGDTRRTFDSSTGAARLVQTDDYYPFGLEINTYTSGIKNEYLYNKKELQEEFTEYDYGARFYDPVIGRWTSVDPSAEKSRRWSPYNYGINNPIRFVDPDGREIVNIPGGVSYRGEDAKLALEATQQALASPGGFKGVHLVFESLTKTIYKHTLDAFRQGKPPILTYDPVGKNERRKQAQKNYPSRYSEGLERDEYPYASTREGGAGASIAYVPKGENSLQGGQLSALYSTLQTGDRFLVLPVPKDKEPDAPIADRNRTNNVDHATKIGLGAVVAIGAYETVKWGIAAFAAPETLGGSLVGAGALP